MAVTPNRGYPVINTSPEMVHDPLPQIRDFQMAVDADVSGISGGVSVFCDFQFANLNAAVAAIGSAIATLRISSPTFADGSACTVPSTLTLEFIGAGMLTVATGHTVTIAGSVIATRRKIFANATAGLGTVVPTNNSKWFRFYHQWWGAVGDGTTDDTAAVQATFKAAIAVFNKAATVDIGNGCFKLTSKVSVGDDSAFVFINIIAEASAPSSSIGYKWAGATNQTMMEFRREKYVQVVNVNWFNSVASGTTIGVTLGGTPSGLQTGVMKFVNCQTDGTFNVGMQLGGTNAGGNDAAANITFDTCHFFGVSKGLYLAGSGNTLVFTLLNCDWGATGAGSYGIDLGTGGDISIIGGGTTMTNEAQSIHTFGNWQNSLVIQGARFEMSPGGQAVGGGSPTAMSVLNCTFTAISTTPTLPVIQSRLNTIISGCFFTGGGGNWKPTGGQQPDLGSLMMFGNYIEGTLPFHIDPANSSMDGLRYFCAGNYITGAANPRQNYIGKVVWPDMVNSLNVYAGSAFGSTSTDGLLLENTNAAAAGAQQYSPRTHFAGRGWKTNATAASQIVDFTVELQPVQGAANPSGNLVWKSQINAAGYNTQLTLTSTGHLFQGGTIYPWWATGYALSGPSTAVYAGASGDFHFLSNAYFPTSSAAYMTSDSNARAADFYLYRGDLVFRTADSGTADAAIAWSQKFMVSLNGNIVCGNAALATNATDGFFYAPSCAGAPSGAPTSYTGRVPIIIDTTNSKMYARVGGAWKSVTLV